MNFGQTASRDLGAGGRQFRPQAVPLRVDVACGILAPKGTHDMTTDQKEAIAKFTRGNFVFGIYRWLIEVGFLFAAFNEFPTHKWSIGLALLAFNGGVAGIGRAVVGLHLSAAASDDSEQRKTRHAAILASEQATDGNRNMEHESFWSEVALRVDREYAALNEFADKPTGFWVGSLLAISALVWELIASLFGIGLVAALTS